MEIDEQIKCISNYFEQKVIDGDFKIVKCSDYTAKIIIDEKYSFTLWIAGDPKNNFSFYTYSNDSDEMLLDCFNTQKTRLAGWKQIKPYIKDFQKKEKERKIKELQSEINKIKQKI
jgi:hypothetical protein